MGISYLRKMAKFAIFILSILLLSILGVNKAKAPLCDFAGKYIDNNGNSHTIEFNGMNFNDGYYVDLEHIIHDSPDYGLTAYFVDDDCRRINWSSGGYWIRENTVGSRLLSKLDA